MNFFLRRPWPGFFFLATRDWVDLFAEMKTAYLIGRLLGWHVTLEGRVRVRCSEVSPGPGTQG